MKKYFWVCVFMLLGLMAKAQTNEEEIIVRKDSFPSKQEVMKRARKSYGPWMISIGGGGARLLARAPDSIDAQQKKYYNHLLWGYTLKGSAYYFLKFGLGFGLQYHAYHSSATLDSTYLQRGRSIEENIGMHFIGVGVQYRLIKKSGSSYLNFGVGLGYFIYNDIGKLKVGNTTVDKIQLTEKSGGVQIQAAYNYRIDPHVSFGLGIGINNGILTGVNVITRDSSYRDTTMRGSLIHFDLNAKLTIIF